MSAQKQLNELAERKRLLVLQSDLHRALLQTEVVNARAQLQWMAQVRAKLSASPWWLAGGGAAAGLLLTRNWRTALKWLPAGLAAWRWLRKMKSS